MQQHLGADPRVLGADWHASCNQEQRKIPPRPPPAELERPPMIVPFLPLVIGVLAILLPVAMVVVRPQPERPADRLAADRRHAIGG